MNNVYIVDCLNNLEVEYDLNKQYINELFLLVKKMLKPLSKKYLLKKRYIVKEIYNYCVHILNIDKRVIKISKLKQPIQRSQEWYDARYNKITASEIASVIGNKTDYICESELKKIYKKAAFKTEYELLKTKILKNDEFKGNVYTDWGILFEPIATLLYEHRNENRIIEFGLIEHPTINILAASPDGITQKNAIMIEIKAPYKRKLSGLVPLNYWMQMQLQMETCNLDVCHFVEVKTVIYSKEEYKMDNYQDENNPEQLFTCDKLEKGKLIKCITSDGKIDYYYPPYDSFRNRSKLKTWIKDRVSYYEKMYEKVEILYWKLEEFSCIEINRDKKWFESVLPKCNEFWEKVLYYKNNKEEFIKLDQIKEDEKAKRRNKESKADYERNNVCMLDSESDDGIETNILDLLTNTVTDNTQETNINENNIENNIEMLVINDNINNDNINNDNINMEILNSVDEIKKNIEKIPSYDSSSDNENMQTAILNRNLSDSIEDDISTLF